MEKLTNPELVKKYKEDGIGGYNKKNISDLIDNIKQNNLEIDKKETKIIILPSKTTDLLKHKIKTILQRPEKQYLTYDILDTKKSKNIKLICLKEKQRQMKIGEIWEECIGNWGTFKKLDKREGIGLDIISKYKKTVIELKNRTNTDNSSSRKSNLDKLSKFKKQNPEYTCIYANINDDTEEKTMKGFRKKIIHNGVEIEHHIGYAFLQFIFEEHTEQIIEFIKDTIEYNS